jgi:hypothetical protein
VSLHALDGNIFPCFYGLSFQYLRERALTLLAYQAILYRKIVYSSDIWQFVKREREKASLKLTYCAYFKNLI